MSRQATIVWFNRFCWLLTVECLLGCWIVASRGEWWLAASFAGFSVALVAVALTEPRNIRKRGEG